MALIDRRRTGLGACLLIAAVMLAVWAPAAVRAEVGEAEAAETEPCANGTVIAEPAAHPQLVADCAVLLGLKDALRGSAGLNWSASRTISSWTGVSVEGIPQRVTSLRLNNRQLNGSLPPTLGQLDALTYLDLGHNRLSGPLPDALGDLWRLLTLYLDDNRLSGPIPHWLDDLPLFGLSLSGNQGWTGCLPAELTGFRHDDLGSLSLSRCAALPTRTLTVRLQSTNRDGEVAPRAGAHQYRQGQRVLVRATPRRDRRVDAWSGACSGDAQTCVVTMDADKSVGVSFEPLTYSVTVTATEGGTVAPTGTTNYTEPTTVTLTASWNDATHSFSGWTGDCVGMTSTCELLVDHDYTVAAAFAELPADRCATPTASDCIRAVFLGAPTDFAQVVDVPADRLLSPDDEGRYTIPRGEPITVVTAAPLPSGSDRFLLDQRPAAAPDPTAQLRLLPPLGTTFSLTASLDAAADRLAFDLRAARNRPGNRKPIPGDVVATVRFNLQPAPLTLQLTSSRDLCTANTPTELSWSIAGGTPPYALTIDGETVDATADSYRIDCGPIPTDPVTGDPAEDPAKTFSATVSDARTPPESATASLNVSLAAALPAPSDLGILSYRSGRSYSGWTPPEGAGAESTEFEHDGRTVRYDALIRYRAAGTGVWTYALDSSLMARRGYQRNDWPWERPPPGVREWSVAAIRHELEQHAPEALNWAPAQRYASVSWPENVTATATHDTVTVSWDGQPYASGGSVLLEESGKGGGHARMSFERPSDAVQQSVTFEDLTPNTLYFFDVQIAPLDQIRSSGSVTTAAPPPDWQAPVTGPTDVRASTTARSISLSWVRPPGIEHLTYHVLVLKIVDEDYERIVGDGYVLDGSSSWTTLGRKIYIEPESTYRVSLLQLGLYRSRAELTVTTPAESSSSARSSRASGGAAAVEPWLNPQYFLPRWPVMIADYHAYTDDPWDWRTNCQRPEDGVHRQEAQHCRGAGDTKAYVDYGRFHAGLDIGDHDRSLSRTRTSGDPVYASADGKLRLFKHNLDDEEPTHIVYCPGEPGGFADKFALSGYHHKLRDSDVDESCNYLATAYSGRTALIFHEHSEGRFVSKYSHLDIPPISEIADPGLARRLRSLDRDNDGYADPDATVAVQAGDLLGWIGASGATGRCRLNDGGEWTCNVQLSESAFNDPHLHFEVRRFDGRELTGWYRPAHDCHGTHDEYDYCGWTADRRLPTLIDPESWLPPLPASHVPRDAGDQTLVTGGNADRRVFEVLRLHPGTADEQLSLDLSAAFWRPAFYSRYVGESYHVGVPDRFRWQGIMGTRPGIDRYYLRVECGGPPRVRRARGAASGHPDGEYPRLVEPLQFRRAAAAQCNLAVLSSNARYDEQLGRGMVVDRSDILLTDPTAQLQWQGSLAEGVSLQSTAQILVGDGLHLFAFRAVPGQTYRFCTTPGTSSTTCADESSADNVAELLIVGPAEAGQNGVVADGPGLVRDLNGLAWTVPDSADATVETYAVVVRRRARYEGGDVPDYSYRLKYTIPDIPECAPPELGDPLVRFCVPQAPLISEVTGLTDGGFTIGFGARYSAAGYEVQLTVDDITTVHTVMNKDPSAMSLSHPFTGLRENTQHRVSVRAWNSTGPSDWSASRTVTTLAAQCPGPTSDQESATSRSAPCPTAAASVGIAAAGDGTVNAAERAAGFNITGTATAGAQVTLTVGATALPAVTADAQGAWSVAIPANAAYVRERTLSLRAIARKTGLTDARASATLSVDLTPPTVTYTPPATLTVGVSVSLPPSTSDTDIAGFAQAAGPELPTGLRLDPTSGLIDGAPSTPAAARSVGVLVRDRARNSARVAVSLPAVEPSQSCTPPASTRTHETTEFQWTGSGAVQEQEQRTKRQAQRRTVSWNLETCTGTTGAWTNLGAPSYSSWRETGVQRCNPGHPPRPLERKTESVVDTWWVLRGTTAHERQRTDTEHYSRIVTRQPLPECGWNTPDWGEPDRTVPGTPRDTGSTEAQPLARQPRPAGEGQTRWTVSSSAACSQIEQLEQLRTRTPTFSRTSGWDDPPWGPWSEPYRSGWQDGRCIDKPPDDVVTTTLSTTQTRWVSDDTGIVCLDYQEQRTGTKQRYHRRPHVWSGASAAWIDGTRNPAPFFTDPVYSWSGWTRTGALRLCAGRAADGDDATGDSSAAWAELPAGDYLLQWGERRLRFTVPQGAVVTLRRRQLESGVEAAVFSLSNGAELVVDPSALSDDGPSGDDVDHPTLTALAASIRLEPETATAAVQETERECAELQPGAGASTIVLDQTGCAVARGGGSLDVALGSQRLLLSLPQASDWLIAVANTDHAQPALALVELTDGGFVILSAADGTELSRSVQSGSAGEALLDAIVATPVHADEEQ